VLTACTSVDVLFVIDNSGSMADQQDSLVASFDGFVRGMQERLADATSYHIGVVTTDDYRFNAPGCQNIGDLVTRTGGGNSSDMDCQPFASGASYMSDADIDLEARFSCAAKVGTFGADDERAMRALLNAVDPASSAPGACNAGFIRPDSLLVIVIISDEDDVKDGCTMDGFGETCDSYGSGGSSADWVAELRGYRPNPDSVVVLSLIGRSADNPCGAVVSSHLLGFARRFGDNGFVGDVCASSYDGFFAEALPIINTACVNLI